MRAETRNNSAVVSARPSSPVSEWRGVLGLVAAALLWSLNGPLIKLLSDAAGGEPPLSAITIACYRSLLGGLLFLPAALRGLSTLRAVRAAWPIGSVAAFTVMTYFFVLATTLTAAANAILLQYTSPLWVFALSPLLLGERAHPRDALALAAALVGVSVIFAGHGVAQALPLFLGLVSGMGYGLLTITLRGLRNVSPLLVVALNFAGSGILLLPAVLAWGELWLTPRQWALIALFSIVQFATPYVIFSWSLRYIEAHRASLILLLEAVLNPLLTWLIVGERVPTPTLLGGPLILSSVAWLIVARRGEARR
jgi:drug/metabolite transporter (DMT)-like permease